MAKAVITPHDVDSRQWARLSGGTLIGNLGGQSGDAFELNIGDEPDNSAPAPKAGLYRIVIMGADCRLRIGKDATADPETGEPWFDGDSDVRYLRGQERISIVAAS